MPSTTDSPSSTSGSSMDCFEILSSATPTRASGWLSCSSTTTRRVTNSVPSHSCSTSPTHSPRSPHLCMSTIRSVTIPLATRTSSCSRATTISSSIWRNCDSRWDRRVFIRQTLIRHTTSTAWREILPNSLATRRYMTYTLAQEL